MKILKPRKTYRLNGQLVVIVRKATKEEGYGPGCRVIHYRDEFGKMREEIVHKSLLVTK